MPASDELAAELRSVIQRHRPDWTNSGDGDPGVTLVELFAFLGDEGREIVVGCPVELALPRERGSGFLSLEYRARARERERERDPVPAGDAMQATRVEEGYELFFAPAPFPDAVPVAQLVRRSGRWRLNKRFRVRRVTGRDGAGRARRRGR